MEAEAQLPSQVLLQSSSQDICSGAKAYTAPVAVDHKHIRHIFSLIDI